MKKISIIIFIFLVSAGFILSQSITVIGPNGGEKLVSGSSFPIKWNASGTTNPFKITLWRNGALVGIIKSESDAGTGVRTFEWTVGNLEGGGKADVSTGYKIKVKERKTPVADESDGEFEIIPFVAMMTATAAPVKRPDLKISIRSNPESPAVGEKTLVEFRVENIGDRESTASKIRVYMGTRNTDTWDITSLPVGRFVSMEKKLTPEAIGYILWSAYIDKEKATGDSDWTNNYAKTRMVIRGPDLIISKADSPDVKQIVGQKCIIRVIVKNVGQVKADIVEVAVDFDTCPLIAKALDRRKHKGGLAPGDEVTFMFSHRYACYGNKWPKIFVDKENKVKESDETNNTAPFHFHISGDNIVH